jgi:hypothetical protein
MIYLINKTIDPDTMLVLYEKPLSAESIASDFTVYGGDWKVEEGWLTGRNPGNSAGMIISKADFFGDVMMDFTARGPGYVIGIPGWWYGKIGFESYCTQVQIRDVKIRRALWQPHETAYTSEF